MGIYYYKLWDEIRIKDIVVKDPNYYLWSKEKKESIGRKFVVKYYTGIGYEAHDEERDLYFVWNPLHIEPRD